jgi:hypothetical protein
MVIMNLVTVNIVMKLVALVPLVLMTLVLLVVEIYSTTIIPVVQSVQMVSINMLKLTPVCHVTIPVTLVLDLPLTNVLTVFPQDISRLTQKMLVTELVSKSVTSDTSKMLNL